MSTTASPNEGDLCFHAGIDRIPGLKKRKTRFGWVLGSVCGYEGQFAHGGESHF